MPQLSAGLGCVERSQTERVSICVGGCENIKTNETWSKLRDTAFIAESSLGSSPRC